MIRPATRSDLNTVTDLVMEFLQTTSYHNHTLVTDHGHIRRMMYALLYSGYIWLYYSKDVPVGLLIAVKEANTWIPEKKSLRELVWYVREEYRNTVGAGRLFVEFCNTGDDLLSKGEIQGYFTTRMTTTTDYDLERRGFRLTEKLYLKDI
jgi:hypothetical protein